MPQHYPIISLWSIIIIIIYQLIEWKVKSIVLSAQQTLEYNEKQEKQDLAIQLELYNSLSLFMTFIIRKKNQNHVIN